MKSLRFFSLSKLFFSFLIVFTSCNRDVEKESCVKYIKIQADVKEVVAGVPVQFSNVSDEDSIKLALGIEEEPSDNDASIDPDDDEDDVKLFYWNFGDNTPVDSSNRAPSHRFEKEGEYLVKLVYKGGGEAQINIKVLAPPPVDSCEGKPLNATIEIIPPLSKTKKGYFVGEEITLRETSKCGHTWEWYGAGEAGVIGRGRELKRTFRFAEDVKIWVKVNPGDKTTESPELSLKILKVIKPPKPSPITPGGKKVVEIPKFKVDPQLGMKLQVLFIRYLTDPKAADEIKEICEKNGFKTNASLVKFRTEDGTTIARARADIENDKYKVKSVRIIPSKMDGSVEKVIIE